MSSFFLRRIEIKIWKAQLHVGVKSEAWGALELISCVLGSESTVFCSSAQNPKLTAVSLWLLLSNVAEPIVYFILKAWHWLINWSGWFLSRTCRAGIKGDSSDPPSANEADGDINRLRAEWMWNMPEEWQFGLFYLENIFLIMLEKTLKLFMLLTSRSTATCH